jgi:hypothetical protein
MPAVLWIAFWSSMMGAAAGWGDVSRPVPAEPQRRSD